MTSNNNGYLLNRGLTYGAFVGGALVMMMVVLYFLGEKTLITTGLGHYLILSYGIHRCQTSWKLANMDAGFGVLLLIGVICGVAASLFVDLYAAVYVKLIDPGYADAAIEQSVETIRQMNLGGPAEVEQASGMVRKVFTISLAISNTLIYALVSLFFSAIFAFFVNKIKNQN